MSNFRSEMSRAAPTASKWGPPFSKPRALLLSGLLLLLAHSALAQTLPEGAAAISARDKGAKGDGVADDTQAINAAFAAQYSAWEEIYLPAGTYLVSGPIDVGRFETLRGDGPGKTIIKLKNAAAGYGDKANPNWVLRSWRGCCADSDNDNQTQSVHVLNLTVDVGDDNPGAVAVNFLSNNGGGLENVVLKAGSNSGAIGLRLERNSPGPALINNLKIFGFDYGIKSSWGVYGMTFEDIELSGQHVAGWDNNGQPLAIRHLVSTNSVPAITNQTQDYGMLLLLDSTLNGGAATNAAIQSTGASYLRNVCTTGYRAALSDGKQDLAGPIAEHFSQDPAVWGATPKRSLNLPIRDMFVPTWDAASEWANVTDYPSLQAAIDSGKKTIYFPNYTNPYYTVGGPIHVRGAVRNIIGLNAGINQATLSIETTDPSAVIYIEQLRDFVLEQRSPATVVIRRSLGAGPLKTFAGAGDLLVDDWCCGNFEVQKSNVWVRQLNEESTGEKLLNQGGKLWVLGLKTEQFGTVGHFSEHAASEILGGLIYPAQGTPTTPMYINDNSDFSAMHRELGSYPIQAREIHDGVSNDIAENSTFYVSNLGNTGTSVSAPNCSGTAGAAGSGGSSASAGGSGVGVGGGASSAGGAGGASSSPGGAMSAASGGAAGPGATGGAPAGTSGSGSGSNGAASSTPGGHAAAGCGCRVTAAVWPGAWANLSLGLLGWAALDRRRRRRKSDQRRARG